MKNILMTNTLEAKKTPITETAITETERKTGPQQKTPITETERKTGPQQKEVPEFKGQ